MEIEWSLDLTVIVSVVAACIVVTLFAGFTGTWRAMGIKAAPLLRNE
jgi:putative ABC transport system permease protein